MLGILASPGCQFRLSGWERGPRFGAFGLLQDSCNASAGNPVRLSQLSQAQAKGSVSEQSSSINLNRLPAQHANLFQEPLI